MIETIYVFVGDGQGVPGLPHRVTEAEAAAIGASKLLADAIENGNYRAEGEAAKAKAEPKASGSIDLADGTDDGEARLAGQALAERKKRKGE